MKFKINALSEVFSSLQKSEFKISDIIKRIPINFSSRIPFKIGSKFENNESINSSGFEFLLVCLVNYKLYIYKLNKPGSPEVISESNIDIPASCLGDSDIINLEEFSELVLGQLVMIDPTVSLPAYILIDPDYFSSETTILLDKIDDEKYLSLSPFVAADTLSTCSKFSYSKASLGLFEESSENLGSISKLHNSANIDLNDLSTKDFVRLDFSSREFMQKITSPFAQVSLPISYITSLDYPIIDSIQGIYSDFNFFLSCGKKSSILYMIHSDGFAKSFRIPIGINMYFYPIDNIIEFDELLKRLSQVIGKIIKDTSLKYKSSKIIISGLDIDFRNLDPNLFADSNLEFISLSNYIKSLSQKILKITDVQAKYHRHSTKDVIFICCSQLQHEGSMIPNFYSSIPGLTEASVSFAEDKNVSVIDRIFQTSPQQIDIGIISILHYLCPIQLFSDWELTKESITKTFRFTIKGIMSCVIN